jgi:carboxymethylenebutenolidase
VFDTNRIQLRISSGNISVVNNQDQYPAFLAHPLTGKQRPGLIMLHSQSGLNAQMRTWGRRFAEAGFYVIAPDLYDGETPTSAEEIEAMRQKLGGAQLAEGVGYQRFVGVLDVLRTHHHCTGKIAVVGWDIGGEIALYAASQAANLVAVASICANPSHYLNVMSSNRLPTLMFYADSDEAVPPPVLYSLSKALPLSPAHETLVMLPSATGHYWDERSDSYHPQYAAKTFTRLVEFFAEHTEHQAEAPAAPKTTSTIPRTDFTSINRGDDSQ